jgi:nucleoside 2-deoxyribosyltransferase
LKIYLAGPDVFLPDVKRIACKKKSAVLRAGFEPLFPLDNEVQGNTGDIARQVYEANLLMIDQCDVVLANLSPFRGLHADVGTAFEVGYAAQARKHIVCYSNCDLTLKQRSEKDSGNLMMQGETVEDFGLGDNLMLTTANAFFAVPEHDMAAYQAFERALDSLVVL